MEISPSGAGIHIICMISDSFVFDRKTFYVKRFAKNLGKAEYWAFVNCTVVQMPTDILADNGGAEVSVLLQM